MDTEHELTWVEFLVIEALKNELPLSCAIQLIEELVLIELVDHKEMLSEATLQIRQFLKVFSTEENDLCMFLHADQPSHWREHDRTVFINF